MSGLEVGGGDALEDDALVELASEVGTDLAGTGKEKDQGKSGEARALRGVEEVGDGGGAGMFEPPGRQMVAVQLGGERGRGGNRDKCGGRTRGNARAKDDGKEKEWHYNVILCHGHRKTLDLVIWVVADEPHRQAHWYISGFF